MELGLSQKGGCVLWGLIGLILALFGLITLTSDPIGHLVKHITKLRNGSFVHEMWKKLPVEIHLKIYLFNITNAERFLSGKDQKINLEEVGPYVFRESRGNKNIKFHENGTLSYIPSVNVTPVLEKSVGDPKVDRIIVANLPMLGILSLYSNASKLKKLGIKSFIWSIDAQPTLDLSVEEYMWGYQDKLIRLVSGYAPSWIDFDKFGILDRVYADKTSVVTIDVNEASDSLYSIQLWNGSPGLREWGYTDMNTSLPCNVIKGAYEGLLFPSDIKPGDNLKVYKKIFCRTLPLEYVDTVTLESGLMGYKYILPSNALSCKNPDNQCYCPKDGPCMAEGLSDITPCYYGLPVALSFPHFHNSDKRLLDRINGLNPDEKLHSSFAVIQPQIGMPMKISSKTQLSMVISDVSYISKVKAFSNLSLPILWMDGSVEELPEDFEFKVLFLFIYLPRIQTGLCWILILVGLTMFIYKSVTFTLIPPEKPSMISQQPLKYIQVAVTDITNKEL